jgi:hypothetical protein
MVQDTHYFVRAIRPKLRAALIAQDNLRRNFGLGFAL